MRQRDGVSAQRSVNCCLQVSLRIDAGQLGALDQAVEDRGDLGALLGLRAVVVLRSYDDAAECPIPEGSIDRAEES